MVAKADHLIWSKAYFQPVFWRSSMSPDRKKMSKLVWEEKIRRKIRILIL